MSDPIRAYQEAVAEYARCSAVRESTDNAADAANTAEDAARQKVIATERAMRIHVINMLSAPANATAKLDEVVAHERQRYEAAPHASGHARGLMNGLILAQSILTGAPAIYVTAKTEPQPE